jgi:hypothetical protein
MPGTLNMNSSRNRLYAAISSTTTTEVVIGITGRRETFEDFCSPPYTGDELRDELRIVAVERYVKDGGCCEARLGLLLVRPSA